jgi:hypothetical protein
MNNLSIKAKLLLSLFVVLFAGSLTFSVSAADFNKLYPTDYDKCIPEGDIEFS